MKRLLEIPLSLQYSKKIRTHTNNLHITYIHTAVIFGKTRIFSFREIQKKCVLTNIYKKLKQSCFHFKPV